MNTQKLKASWHKTMAAAFAVSAMAIGAQGAEKITVDEVANHYPWDGKVDCVTTLSGLETSGCEYEGVFTLSVKKDGTTVRKVVTNAFASADGTYTNTFDCTALFGAGLYPNGGIAVDLVREKQLGGVQLWKDGPYWAECNVGATKPEEYGYYFMWGDTNAYVRNANNDGWVSVKNGSSFAFSLGNCPTDAKDNAALLSEGYIDSTGNLMAAHDAATAYLGGPWRMPTSDEIQALVDKCTTEWITTNGVYGCLVKGTGDYVTKSIFLPTAGFGRESDRYDPGSSGFYWSSSPNSGNSYYALYLSFGSGYFGLGSYDYRSYGQSVRPLRGFAQ